MEDRELLELAAKARGLTGEWWERYPGEWCLSMHGEGNSPPTNWNPLTDDGDALRLAVKLNIPIYPYDDETSTGTVGVVAKNWGSKEENTRRAIVRAAAAMAEALPNDLEVTGPEGLNLIKLEK